MKRYWRYVIPNIWLMLLFGVLYIASYRVDNFCARYDIEVPIQLTIGRLFVLLAFAVIHAAFRVFHFHPFGSGQNMLWLANTPWTFDKPLPFGPVHLTIFDVLLVAVLCVLQYINGSLSWLWPAMVFLCVYSTLTAAMLFVGQEVFAVLYFVLLPLAIFPHRSPVIATAVLAGLYVLVFFGVKRQLQGFPWNTEYWQFDPVKRLRQQAKSQGLIGWPHRMLNIHEAPESNDIGAFLLICFVVIWWIHVIRWVADRPYDYLLLAIPGAILPIGRLAAYVIPGYLPPINLWGRLFTFRWIIPGYDKIFIGPICIGLVCALTMYFNFKTRLDSIWIFEASVFAMFALALTVPPSPTKWHLTGSHRLARPSPSQRYARNRKLQAGTSVR